MPSSLAHYAFSAAGLRVLDLPPRKLALYSLWAVAPDLDIAPAIAWTLSAPHLPLSADALRTGARLFGHRGFSHTIAAALLAGLLVWGLTRDRRHGLAAGLAWATHVVLDTLTDWSTIPFWPVSDAELMIPLVTGLDPLLTLASLGTIVALLGPIATEKLGWPGETKRASLAAWGRRWGPGLAYASVAAVAFSAAMVGWTAASDDAGLALPADAPRTAALDRPANAEADAWAVTTRWLPPTEGDTRRIPYVANASEAPANVVPAAECAFDALGPFAPVDRPVWRLHREGETWIASAQDLVRNATGTDGPRLHVAVANGTPQSAWIGGGPDGPRFRTELPTTLLEASSCP